MRELTKIDVLNIANHLIKLNGKTTTLEVRKELFNKGYNVSEMKVSTYLYELAKENNWEQKYNGDFDEFSFPIPKYVSKEKSEEQVKKEFINKVQEYIDYWVGIKSQNIRECANGVAFSILNIIDGTIGDLPKFILAPNPHIDDKQFLIKNNEDYYPENNNSKIKCDISGDLHTLFTTSKKEEQKQNYTPLSCNLRGGKVVITLNPETAPKNSWKISSKETDKVLYFDGNLSLEQARYAFYAICNLSKGANYKSEKIK